MRGRLPPGQQYLNNKLQGWFDLGVVLFNTTVATEPPRLKTTPEPHELWL